MKALIVIAVLLISPVLTTTRTKAETEVFRIKLEVVCDRYDITSLSTVLGLRESGNSYTIVNSIGCMGKYQFKRSTLTMLDIGGTNKEFLADSCLQEEAFRRLLDYNYQFIVSQGLIYKVGDSTIDGVHISLEGLLAGSHLGGPVSMYDYIINRDTTNRTIRWYGRKVKVYKRDHYRTHVKEYLQLFN